MGPRLSVIEGGAGAPPSRRRALECLALGAALTLACSFAASLPSWRTDLPLLQMTLFTAFAILAFALARAERWRHLPHAGLAVFVVALAMRLAVIPVAPTLSDDVYRYVWDGRVLLHGFNPYAHSPADPALAALREPLIHAHINHPELRTIYPPLAEAGFALVALVSPTVPAMKAWILVNDLALVALLAWWSERRTGSPWPAIAYAWNPLVVAEYAGSAHHDPTALLPFVLALALAEERPVASALALSAAVLIKLAPLLALPFLLVRWPWRARIVALATLAAGLGGFAALALGEHSGLAAFTLHWRDNDALFTPLAAVFGDARARGVAAVLVAGGIAVLLIRRADALAGTRAATRAALLLGPTVHPWYLGWALVQEPLSPSAPWLLLSCLSLLSYGVLATPAEGGSFHLPLAWRVLEYGLPALLALAGFARARRLRAEGRAHV